MKIQYYFLAIASFLFANSNAQLNYSSLTSENIPGTYVDLGTNGSVISTTNQDNANSASQNIGFTFDYNGSSFTSFVLNTNGFIRLGSSAPSGTAMFFSSATGRLGGPINSTNAADVNLLIPFNHDLTAAASGAEYRVYTSGTSPSRVCTIQFKNVKDKTTVPYNQFDSINFQIKLYESTNVIDFVYGNWYSSSDSSRFKSAACGLKGDNSTSLHNMVMVSKGSTQDYSAAAFFDGFYPTNTNTFNFGNANAGNGAGPNGSRPIVDPGRTYRFTPGFSHDIRINHVFTQGDAAIPYGNPHVYRASVSNAGTSVMTNVIIYLKITGANSYLDSATYAAISPLTSFTVSFTNFSSQNLGLNNVEVFVGPDSNNINNSINYRQMVTNELYAQADTTTPNVHTVGFGAGNGGGAFLQKYHVYGKRRITKTWAYISADVNNVGKGVFGCVVNSAGTYIGRSATYIIQASDLETWVSFNIDRDASNNMSKAPLISNADFYAGLVAPSNPTVRYNPVGHSPEKPIQPQTYYYLGLLPPATLIPVEYSAANSLEFRNYVKAVARGNSLKIMDVSLTDPQCINSNKTVEVTLLNKDSIPVDFSIDNLNLKIITTGAVNQVDSTVITTGSLLPDSTETFTITNSLNLGVGGLYNVVIEAITDVEVDTVNNYKNFAINVVDTPAVTIDVSPDSIVCFGTPVVFIATPYTAGSSMYQWKVNGVNQGSVTSDSSFSQSLVWGDTVSAELITDHCTTGTFSVLSNQVVMKINPMPRPINGISDRDTVIENSSKNYIIGVNPSHNYLWKIIGGTLVGDSTTNSIQVNWGGPSLNAEVSVTETDASNCVRTNVLPTTIISIVGVDEKQSLGFGLAYPNPADNTVNIPVYSNEIHTINLGLFDITGKKIRDIYNGNIQNDRLFSIDVSTLNEGLYFYKIRTSEGFEKVNRLSIKH